MLMLVPLSGFEPKPVGRVAPDWDLLKDALPKGEVLTEPGK